MRSLIVGIVVAVGLAAPVRVSADAGRFESKVDSLLATSLPDTTRTNVPVYLYGVRHDPPHVCEWREHVLYCHGIQIYPRVKGPTPEPSAAVRERFALDCRADSAAKATGKAADSREALEAKRLVYAASPLVTKSWYDDKGQLLVQFRSLRFPIGIGTPLGVDRQPGIPVDPYAEAESMNLLLQNAWKWGRIAFIGSDYNEVISSITRAERQLSAAGTGVVDTDGPISKEALRDVIARQGEQR